MKVRVLGCFGAIANQSKAISFLMDGEIRVGAGFGVRDWEFEQ